jgi:lysophospholipase L1-like esterase
MFKRSKGFLAGFLSCAVLAAGIGIFAASEKTLTALYDDIKIFIDGSQITPKDADGAAVEPFIVDGTTYLPVRAVAEAFGKDVQWEEETRSVKIGTAEAPLKVACVGDSITEGAGLANPAEESYPAQLQELLGDEYIVRNFGASGASALTTALAPYTATSQYKASVDFKPDVVMIMLGTNDIKDENWLTGKDAFEKDYAAIIDSYKTANPRAEIFVGIPPRIFMENVYGTRSPAILENEGIPAVKNVIQRTNATPVDVFAATVGKAELFEDFLHPNKEGAGVVAGAFADALSSKGLVS